jgi:hypothetical protein
MALNAAETLAKSAGDVYLAPVGTGAPDAADLDDSAALELDGWYQIGWLSEDGPELANFEGETTKHAGWNRIAPIRTVTRVAEPEITVPLLQWNVENLQRYFLGSTYNVGTKTLTIPESGSPEESELLLVVADGDKYIGLWFGKVSGRPGGTLSFPDGAEDLAPIPITFDVLSADPYAAIIGVEEAAEESA